ncbi:related to CEF1-required during G2/M transition [Sporisorium reilianum f. sp. reilianum]|uniref:Pre-mRNA-splicing factor CEF1 n=1 Tax=Sporisorium reilianum f. sp. reilianum TaxID=72559 RepID=A0A2N8UJA7_9BASI|nr:related to CEF1-required during G2/M transition [Sporisorium reilianum f. sp. reilianum]
MVRVIIKGGVWKNTEDEILKAAISKYGKNQWARISSLLVRKTPKQCKARWYEWLDPSIKKTEWSKEEDEKLLHLAKLMPTQWRTIAPLVGRTANQCLERYQRLLDEAEAQHNQPSSSSLGLTGTGEAVPSADDVRRLRPGEIDPDPETKPARPDPIDMDEDEKEMLSEARARLANTQGKKAKRKARERALEEARRLAVLQKRRELKAAGITIKQKTKKGVIDYNADIPYEKKPLPGFYDTSAEASKSYKAPVGKTLQELNRRNVAPEDPTKNKRQREADEKNKLAKEASASRNEEQIRKLKEAEQITKRRKLNLPAAQVGQDELEAIVKIGQAGERARSLVEEGSSDATHGLLEKYSALDSTQTARTPQVAAHEDSVMREARNLRLMSSAQTPLLGDANADLHSSQSSVAQTPGSYVPQTPNPLLTDSDRDSRSHAGDSTPQRTPLRDNLGLNVEDRLQAGHETPRDLKRARNLAQSQLRQNLSSLPAPKNDFDIVVDDDEEQPQASSTRLDESVPISEEDAAERDARLARQAAEEQAKAEARRSQVVRRNLPRPAHVDLARLEKHIESSYRDRVELLVARETAKLLHHDANMHPIAGGKHPEPESVQLESLTDASLAAARELMRAELAEQFGFPGASQEVLQRLVGASLDDDEEAMQKLEAALKQRWHASRNDKAALVEEVVSARAKMAEAASQASKGEKTLLKVLGGYKARSEALSASAKEQFKALEEAAISRETFERLLREEQGGKAERLDSLRSEVDRLASREGLAQTAYKALQDERNALQESCEMLEMEINMRQTEALNEAALAQ